MTHEGRPKPNRELDTASAFGRHHPDMAAGAAHRIRSGLPSAAQANARSTRARGWSWGPARGQSARRSRPAGGARRGRARCAAPGRRGCVARSHTLCCSASARRWTAEVPGVARGWASAQARSAAPGAAHRSSRRSSHSCLYMVLPDHLCPISARSTEIGRIQIEYRCGGGAPACVSPHLNRCDQNLREEAQEPHLFPRFDHGTSFEASPPLL